MQMLVDGSNLLVQALSHLVLSTSNKSDKKDVHTWDLLESRPRGWNLSPSQLNKCIGSVDFLSFFMQKSVYKVDISSRFHERWTENKGRKSEGTEIFREKKGQVS